MLSFDNDNNDNTVTHNDIILENEYHPPAPLPTTTCLQQLRLLKSAEDVQNGHDLYHKLYALVLRKRQQKK